MSRSDRVSVVSHRAVTSELSSEAEQALTGAIGGSDAVAFVNFPNIGNLGDSAIYCGTKRLLERIGVKPVLTVEPAAYRRRLVRKAIGEGGTILIQGGGNLGDLYRKQGQQRVRMRLFRDFPKAKLIQLPQTLYFSNDRPAERFARLCSEHEDYTLLLRDRVSIERADALSIESVFCPDLAVGLGPLERLAEPEAPVAWLAREDAERGDAPGHPDSFDWPAGDDQRLGSAGARLARDLRSTRRGLGLADRVPARFELAAVRRAAGRLDRIAGDRTDLARRLIARGEVLVTDRFHAHLLACLTGVPNVLLDNSYGKNRGIFDAWSGRFEMARFASDPSRAQALAAELAPG